MRIGVDIDDTLCAFTRNLVDFVKEKYSIDTRFDDYTGDALHKVWGISKERTDRILKEFIYSTTYTPYPGSQDTLIHFKDKFTFYAITARDYELTEHTRDWLNTYYPGVFADVVLCNNYGLNDKPRLCKTAVCKDLGITLFIDDRPDNIVCPSIRTVVYNQPWNQDASKERVHSWEDIKLLLLRLHLNLNRPRIGLSGKLGSGKSTVCSIIKTIIPEFTSTEFAKRVKETASALTGAELELFYTRKGKATMFQPFNKTLGQILQEMSESLKCAFGVDMWIKLTFDVDSFKSGLCIVEDARFKSEANALIEAGAILLRLEGDPSHIRELNEDKRDLTHISEIDLDDYPFEHTIHNTGDLSELRQKVLEFLYKL